eukprot:TRINITY_DN4788_c0_g1_i2.p1 TRINITY_DN4788_c0_g1~~TRINITY_DN4788_c0_g1_i2.p1  ORF type:complete len:489 (+),score=87.28 TRINITY_DN4788_c0_g1_i2:106-1467(+)
MLRSLVGSEMCIRDRVSTQSTGRERHLEQGWEGRCAPRGSCEQQGTSMEMKNTVQLLPLLLLLLSRMAVAKEDGMLLWVSRLGLEHAPLSLRVRRAHMTLGGLHALVADRLLRPNDSTDLRDGQLRTIDGCPLQELHIDGLKDGDHIVLLRSQELFMFSPSQAPYRVTLPREGRRLEVTSLGAPARAFVVEEFLLPGEAEQLIALAEPHLRPSGIGLTEEDAESLADADRERVASAGQSRMRKSDSTFLPSDARGQDGTVATVQGRVARVLRLGHKISEVHEARTHMEEIQVVRYRPGGHYNVHHDSFPSASGESRMATVLIYLNDRSTMNESTNDKLVKSFSGGETWFPPEDRPGSDYISCQGGIRVVPKKNRAVLFYNLVAGSHMPSEGGLVDVASWHAGCRVRAGEKWVASQWVWNTRFPDLPDDTHADAPVPRDPAIGIGRSLDPNDDL